MFKHILDFGYVRQGFKQAFGFYLVHFLFGIILGGLAGAAFGLGGTEEEVFQKGVRIGQWVAVVYSLLIGFLILHKKELLGSVKHIALTVLAGVLAFVGGALLGLIPVAYLTAEASKAPSSSQLPPAV